MKTSLLLSAVLASLCASQAFAQDSQYQDGDAPPPPPPPATYRDTPPPPPPVRYRHANPPPPPASAYRDAPPAYRDSRGQYDVDSRSSARYNTPDGPLTVHTSQPGPRDYGPPPDFSQLDRRGAGYVTADDAAAYPPLANDFIYADSNRDGRVSRAEYGRWAAHQ